MKYSFNEISSYFKYRLVDNFFKSRSTATVNLCTIEENKSVLTYVKMKSKQSVFNPELCDL